jgi:hypothetical protein
MNLSLSCPSHMSRRTKFGSSAAHMANWQGRSLAVAGNQHAHPINQQNSKRVSRPAMHVALGHRDQRMELELMGLASELWETHALRCTLPGVIDAPIPAVAPLQVSNSSTRLSNLLLAWNGRGCGCMRDQWVSDVGKVTTTDRPSNAACMTMQCNSPHACHVPRTPIRALAACRRERPTDAAGASPEVGIYQPPAYIWQ